MNLLEIRESKCQGRRLTMVTAYDTWSAKLLAETPVDILLVGDSAAMVMHGFDDTLPATLEMMEAHTAAVKRGAGKKFIVADLPFLSFRSSLPETVAAVRRLMQAGAQAVKLEGYDESNHAAIAHLAQSGIPVMGHLGLTPQFVNMLGGFRVQGRSEDAARRILEQARGLESAGCFSLVLECVPQALAAEITASVKIPTIGIGAGLQCDGQVLVLQDLLGLSVGFRPKFVRNYMDGAGQFRAAIENFCADVQQQRFPQSAESYE